MYRISLIHIALIMLCSCVLALLVNVLRPQPMAWDGSGIVSIQQERIAALRITGVRYSDDVGFIRTLIRSGEVTFVDARNAEDFARGHVAGALSLPGTQLGASMSTRAQEYILPIFPIVIYCSSQHCSLAHDTALFLQELGFENIYIFTAGWDILQDSDIETGKGVWK